MKSSILSILVCAVAATPLIKNDVPALPAPGDLPTGTVCFGPGGRVADPPGAAPLRAEVKANSKIAGAKRVKLRHGPYKVPNMMVKSVSGDGGALWNCGDNKIQKPCEGECFITSIVAGLEYPNGTNANIDSGMWLHHMVLVTAGPGRWDPTCYGKVESLPHFAVSTKPEFSERSFASGNERTPVDFGSIEVDGKQAGYQLHDADRLRVIVDLMNMNMDDRVVYLTMTYDYVEGKLPEAFHDLKPIWFDADQCGMSELHPPKQSGKFVIPAKPWYPNFEGTMAGVGGHLHDGGTSAHILLNDAMVCDSAAKYSESPEYVYRDWDKTMGSGEQYAKDHISSMNLCYLNKAAPKLDPKQAWVLNAMYDYDKFPGNKEANGKQADIMSIAIAYATVKQGGVPVPK